MMPAFADAMTRTGHLDVQGVVRADKAGVAPVRVEPDHRGQRRADRGVTGVHPLEAAFDQRRPTEPELRTLFADARQNIALLTTGLVVFDCDDPAVAERVVSESGETPYRVRTPRAASTWATAPAAG